MIKLKNYIEVEEWSVRILNRMNLEISVIPESMKIVLILLNVPLYMIAVAIHYMTKRAVWTKRHMDFIKI